MSSSRHTKKDSTSHDRKKPTAATSPAYTAPFSSDDHVARAAKNTPAAHAPDSTNAHICRIMGGNHHTPNVSRKVRCSSDATPRVAGQNASPVMAMRTVANLVTISTSVNRNCTSTNRQYSSTFSCAFFLSSSSADRIRSTTVSTSAPKQSEPNAGPSAPRRLSPTRLCERAGLSWSATGAKYHCATVADTVNVRTWPPMKLVHSMVSDASVITGATWLSTSHTQQVTWSPWLSTQPPGGGSAPPGARAALYATCPLVTAEIIDTSSGADISMSPAWMPIAAPMRPRFSLRPWPLPECGTDTQRASDGDCG
mmetsp:Transcript_40215/g.119885  ORF Transcript_40215/g.119885 Transcript_40215/m.119885 type:complete len:311 (-) Transcript_40215:17-949(-)